MNMNRTFFPADLSIDNAKTLQNPLISPHKRLKYDVYVVGFHAISMKMKVFAITEEMSEDDSIECPPKDSS